MRAIDLRECHRLLLDIAILIDRVCRQHGIPYYMLGGTMLGAVRHGGFIPWDDDIDLGIPRAHFDRLARLLDDALRDTPYRLHTYHNSPNKINYLKVVDTRTCIRGAWETTDTGINIDLFPLDRGPRLNLLTRPFASYIYLLLLIKDYKRLNASPRRGLKRLIAATLKRLPFRTDTLIAHIDRCILRHSQSGTSRCINYFGHWRSRRRLRFAGGLRLRGTLALRRLPPRRLPLPTLRRLHAAPPTRKTHSSHRDDLLQGGSGRQRSLPRAREGLVKS